MYLKETGGVLWIGFIWLRAVTIGGLVRTQGIISCG